MNAAKGDAIMLAIALRMEELRLGKAAPPGIIGACAVAVGFQEVLERDGAQSALYLAQQLAGVALDALLEPASAADLRQQLAHNRKLRYYQYLGLAFTLFIAGLWYARLRGWLP